LHVHSLKNKFNMRMLSALGSKTKTLGAL